MFFDVFCITLSRSWFRRADLPACCVYWATTAEDEAFIVMEEAGKSLPLILTNLTFWSCSFVVAASTSCAFLSAIGSMNSRPSTSLSCSESFLIYPASVLPLFSAFAMASASLRYSSSKSFSYCPLLGFSFRRLVVFYSSSWFSAFMS